MAVTGSVLYNKALQYENRSDICASLWNRSMFSGYKMHFKGLEMVTILKISMSCANCLEIAVVTR